MSKPSLRCVCQGHNEQDFRRLPSSSGEWRNREWRKSIVQMTPLKSNDEAAFFWCSGTMKIGCAHERLGSFQIAIGLYKEPLSRGGPFSSVICHHQY